MAITTQGFDFGRGLLGEARQFSALEQQQQQLQQQRFAQQQLEQQVQRQEQIRQLLGQAAQPQEAIPPEVAIGGVMVPQEEIPEQLTQQELIEEARQIDPGEAQRQLKVMGLDDPSRRAEASRAAAQIMSAPFAQREQAIMSRVNELQAQGRDPKDTLELLSMNEAQQNQALTGIQLLDLSTRERLGLQQKRAEQLKIGGPEVKSSKILDDGTTVQSMKDGTTQVISPSGELLAGDARTAAVKEAQRFGVELQGKRAQQREGGKGAAKIALNAFDQVGKIRSNISDLQEGIRLVREEGAEVGPIADRFPSFRAGARKLENLRSRLGLNVVGAVTFGALSEGELNLAKDVALPKGLSEEETVKWMEERIEAQQKLSNNLEEAALYLSEPGNTVADFIRFTKQRDRQRKAAQPQSEQQPATQPAAQPAAQVIRFDAQGNII
jgi:hypothetical protein